MISANPNLAPCCISPQHTQRFLGNSLGCIDNYPAAPNQKFVDRPDEDFDGDGFTEVEGDVYPNGTSADRDDTVYPNAPEICDEKDITELTLSFDLIASAPSKLFSKRTSVPSSIAWFCTSCFFAIRSR